MKVLPLFFLHYTKESNSQMHVLPQFSKIKKFISCWLIYEKQTGILGNFLVSFSISFVFLPKSKPKAQAQAHNSYLYCNTTSNGILLLQSATCVALLPLLRPHGNQPSPIRKWSVNDWSILLLCRSMLGFHVLETKGVGWWTESTKILVINWWIAITNDISWRLI